jgi:hypothetical protein
MHHAGAFSPGVPRSFSRRAGTDVTDLVQSLLLIRIPKSLDYFSPSLCIPQTLKNSLKNTGKTPI